MCEEVRPSVLVLSLHAQPPKQQSDAQLPRRNPSPYVSFIRRFNTTDCLLQLGDT